MKITVLGCGSSGGVPLIGCRCGVCLSPNLKNRRTRASILVEQGGTRVLVDTSPDLREQALRQGISTVEGVIFTHDHADHTHGIDDVRSFNFNSGQPLPAYGDGETMLGLQQRFSYVFLPPPAHVWFRPAMEANVLAEEWPQTFHVKDMPVQVWKQPHGRTHSLGLRFGDFAYSTDVSALTETACEALRGVKVWMVDCLRLTPAPTHAHLELTLEWIRQVRPERAILTHMAHELEYEALRQTLPTGVEPGFDGMVITLD